MDGEDERGRDLPDDLGASCHIALLVPRGGGAVKARLRLAREHSFKARRLEFFLQNAHEGEVEIALLDARESAAHARVDAAVARVEHDDGLLCLGSGAPEGEKTATKGGEHDEDDAERGQERPMTQEKLHTAIVWKRGKSYAGNGRWVWERAHCGFVRGRAPPRAGQKMPAAARKNSGRPRHAAAGAPASNIIRLLSGSRSYRCRRSCAAG